MLGVLFICIAVSALYLLWFSTTVEMTNFYIKGFNFSLFHGSLPSCTCDMLSWRCIGSNIQHWPFCWNIFFFLTLLEYSMQIIPDFGYSIKWLAWIVLSASSISIWLVFLSSKMLNVVWYLLALLWLQC